MTETALRWPFESGAPAHPHVPLGPGSGLTRATLEAMRLEGLVVHVAGDVYLPADAVAFTAPRVAALRLLVPPGGTVALLAAAWAHGVPVPPDPVDVLVPRAVDVGRRRPGVRQRQWLVPDADVVCLDGLAVTSPARTAADVARHAPAEVARRVVAALLAAGADPRDVLAALPRARRYPGATRGRALVSALTASSTSGGR